MRLVTGLMLGLLAGYGLGRLSSSSAPPAAPFHVGDEVEDPTVERSAPALTTRPERQPPETRDAAAKSGPGIHVARAAFNAAFRAAFAKAAGKTKPTAEQMEAGWTRLQAELSTGGTRMGFIQGRAAEQRVTQAQIEVRDDIITLLSDKGRKDDLAAVVRDVGALDRLFTHQERGPTLPGAKTVAAAESAPVPAGAVLDFGPGVHVVDWNPLERGATFPRDLTIQGGGMDRTLLTLSDLGARSVIFNLHLTDCTIDCGNDGAFDLGSKGAAIRAERVRFVRFDAAHGGAYIFAISRKGAVHCVGCEFVCGYGRSPGGGNVGRSLALARFDDCLFDNFVYDPTGQGGLFVRCTFRDCRGIEERMKRALQYPSRSLEFDSCAVRWTLHGEDRTKHDFEKRARDWKAYRKSFER